MFMDVLVNLLMVEVDSLHEEITCELWIRVIGVGLKAAATWRQAIATASISVSVPLRFILIR